MKLLIVDDETLTREGLISFIDWRSLGITNLLEAEDGLSALQIARKEKPDIILCDIRMPRLNGIEMAEQLEAFLPDVSLIFMSGYSDKASLKAAIKLKAVNYLDKPLSTSEIKEAVLEAAKRHKQTCITRQTETLHTFETASQLALLLTKPYKENKACIQMFLHELSLDLVPSCSCMTYIIRLHTAESDTPFFYHLHRDFTNLLHIYHLNVLYVQLHAYYHVYHIVGNQPLSHTIQAAIQAFLNKHFSPFQDFFISHGELVTGLSKAYQSYCSAVIAMQSSFFFEPGSILCPTELSPSHLEDPSIRLQAEPEAIFNQALLSQDQATCTLLLKELFSYYNHNLVLLPNQVKDLYYKLLIMLDDCSQKLKLSLTSNTSRSDVSLIESLENCFTYQSLHALLTHKVDLFFDTLQTHTTEDPTIFLIKTYISKHYSEDSLSIKEISDHVFLSVSYICTYFKNQTGQTLNQYLTDYRMEIAMKLLSDARYQIVDISSKVGYSNGNYFSKSFKKYTGISPSKYRENLLG